MDASRDPPVRVLTHIKRLDDQFGNFFVRVVCDCSASREVEPEALARQVGWKMSIRAMQPDHSRTKRGQWP